VCAVVETESGKMDKIGRKVHNLTENVQIGQNGNVRELYNMRQKAYKVVECREGGRYQLGKTKLEKKKNKKRSLTKVEQKNSKRSKQSVSVCVKACAREL
jgi:hypothetical protein